MHWASKKHQYHSFSEPYVSCGVRRVKAGCSKDFFFFLKKWIFEDILCRKGTAVPDAVPLEITAMLRL